MRFDLVSAAAPILDPLQRIKPMQERFADWIRETHPDGIPSSWRDGLIDPWDCSHPKDQRRNLSYGSFCIPCGLQIN